MGTDHPSSSAARPPRLQSAWAPRTITVAMMDSSASLKLSMRCECWVPSAASRLASPRRRLPGPQGSALGSGALTWRGLKKHGSEPVPCSWGGCLRRVR